MLKLSVALLLSLAALLFLNACKKDYADEHYTEIHNEITPDLSIKVNAAVAGFITDENNDPVAGALVAAGPKQTSTDEYGYFQIANTALTKDIGFIKIVKAGYFNGFETFVAKEGKETFVRVKLLTKTETGSIQAASGGTVSAANGASVTFPANAIVLAANGTTYNGQVHVSARSIDPAAQTAVPADSRGTNTDGHLKLLSSYACVAVELTGDAGERLQVAPGKTASLTIPIAASLVATAPATIPLWSLDETSGLWKQESTAAKAGNSYTGQVSHFSFWDGATGIPLVNLTARVMNETLQPLANVAVVVTQANLPQNAGYGQMGYTDANGYVYGAVPAGFDLVLDVMTTCATPAYSHPFTTTASNIDLGVLTGNMGQNMVTISGTVTNCNGQPVTDGYVQTYDHGFYNRINISNGSFSFTGLACTNGPVNYIVVDRSAQQQNPPQTITLVPGVNNLGAIAACGVSTQGMVVYTIDGITRNVTEPTDTLAAYYGSSFTTIASLNAVQSSPHMVFQMDGGMALGDGHHISDIWSVGYPSGRALALVPLVVTITEYGAIGGFISGHFSGTVEDFTDHSVHQVSYTFRVKRYN